MSARPAGTLYGLFSQIQSEEAEDNIIRERTIKYLAAKVKTFDKDVINKEAEEILWTETKKSLKVGFLQMYDPFQMKT